jgi:palmitoyl transferase
MRLPAPLSRLFLVAALALLAPATARAMECKGDPTSASLAWYERFCSRLTDTWRRGDHDLFVSGYSWHLPFTYTKEKRDELNSDAWGGGYGRTVEEPDGDTHTVYGFAFLDSHKAVQVNVGYAWSRFWGPRDGLQGGLGYTAFIFTRPDIADGFPLPAILPLFSLRYQRVTLQSTFIPTINGGVNNGSVIFFYGRYTFD